MSGNNSRSWLAKYEIKHQHIYMRAAGDMRKDSIVKQEPYEKFIRNKFNVSFILDDPKATRSVIAAMLTHLTVGTTALDAKASAVVDMWRGLGLTRRLSAV